MRYRTLLPAVALTAIGLAQVVAAGPAAAADGTTVTSASNGLRITARPGHANDISISLTNTTFTVKDRGDLLIPGTGCVAVTKNISTCETDGDVVVVNTGDGDDTVEAPTPFDTTVIGGTGADTVTTGTGDDFLRGDAGADVLDGRAGSDDFRDGPDADRITGGPGNDVLDVDVNADGADVFSGGADTDRADYSDRSVGVTVRLDDVANDGQTGEGDDIRSDVEEVIGGDGPDTLVGTGVRNILIGNAGGDTLQGLDGADDLYGDETTEDVDSPVGADTLDGGVGNDDLIGGLGADDARGGAGSDELDYSSRESTARLFVSLDDVKNDGSIGAEGDNAHSDIEILRGGPGDDRLTGSQAPNVLFGNGGDDTFRGEPNPLITSGADEFVGGPGENDVINYANRVTPVIADIGGTGDDGQVGEGDTIGNDVESILGGDADDRLTGDDDHNLLNGGPGVDVLTGLGGDDDFDCGDGTPDLADGGAGFDRALPNCELRLGIEQVGV